MKHFPTALILSTALSLSACGQMGQQLLDPDITFSKFAQPDIKGINDTQEDIAKEATAAGDYKRAFDIYKQLVDSKKGKPEQILRYKLGMAESARRYGDTPNAVAMYEELYRENPGNLEVMEGRGLSMMAAGKTTDAGRAFAEVMEKDPKRWRTLNALGILFVTKNMVPEAIAYYTEALNNSPDNPAILNNVGLSYATDKQYSRAIAALQQGSRLSKTPAQRKQIDLNLAMVQGVSGDLDAARDTASKYLEGAALDNNMGLYAHLAKDDALAKSYLNMALSNSPTFYERAWENLDVVNDTGRSDDADAPSPAPRAASNGKLPKLDALQKPEPKGKRKGKYSKSGHSAAAAAAPAPVQAVEPTLLPEVKAEAPAKDEKKEETKADENKDDSKSDDKKSDDKKADDKKDAGLIVTPGE